ncbi:MAG TPA: nitrate/nitrite transporter NrtS [Acidimicrobiia bacterium]
MPEPHPTWSTPRECARLFAQGVTVRTAGRVAVIVGTILSAVNQGSTIVDGSTTWATWVRVGVNYCVPFIVASIGFLSACKVAPLDTPHR